jgi:hypothetical protein
MKRRAACHDVAQGKSGRPWAVAVARRKDRLGIERYSVAERSFPLLNLLEMLCQPHAQFLLHRWG